MTRLNSHRSSRALVALGALLLLTLPACHSTPAPPPHHAPGPQQPHHGAHDFADAESWAEHFDDPARDVWQRPEAVIDRVGIDPDTVVADIGAGTGYFAVRLARRVPAGKVLAVDVEPDMIRYLDERAVKEGLSNLTAVLGAPDDARLPDRVDVVWMVNTYHHIASRTAYFERLAADITPEGRVVIVDFKMGEQPVGPPDSMKVPPERIIRELADAGYVLLYEDSTLLPHQNLLVFGVVGSR
ncbi:MAG: class I SAM-dependent methyltransferase [Myxococcota bacterium]